MFCCGHSSCSYLFRISFLDIAYHIDREKLHFEAPASLSAFNQNVTWVYLIILLVHFSFPSNLQSNTRIHTHFLSHSRTSINISFEWYWCVEMAKRNVDAPLSWMTCLSHMRMKHEYRSFRNIFVYTIFISSLGQNETSTKNESKILYSNYYTTDNVDVDRWREWTFTEFKLNWMKCARDWKCFPLTYKSSHVVIYSKTKFNFRIDHCDRWVYVL